MASRSHRGSRAAAVRTGARHVGPTASRIVSIARAHEHRSAAALLGLLVLAYLWPALVGGRVLSPTALLYLEPPWAAVRPAGALGWINRELGDVPYAYYAWDVLARRLLHAGTFPAWNPYALAGTPLWANSQIAWLSPFSLPLWILPLNYGLGVAAALKLWCAGFGTYLLGRELRLGFWAAIAAGIAFALCSFNVFWLSYGVFVSVAAMLPWALWLAERVVRRRGPADGPALAAVIAVALLGGHPGTQVHLLAAVALYAVMRAATVRGGARRERGRRLAVVAAAAVVGLLLAAVVLLPAQLAATDTWGVLLREHGGRELPGAHMPAGVARSALFPEWWGRFGEGPLADHGPAAGRERTFFAGAATLVLALVALVAPGAWRRKAPFAVLGVLGLAIAVRVPGLYQLVVDLPGFDHIQNSRIYLWFVLALAVLAGFGLQRVVDTRGRLGHGWLVVAAAPLTGVVVAVALQPDGATWSTALRHMLKRTAERSGTALALASVLWWLVVVAALAALLLLARRARRPERLVALVALLIALELLRFARGIEPIGPSSVLTPPATPAIAYLQRHAQQGRIAGLHALGPDTSTLYGLRDAGGSDAPQPSLRYAHLWHLADPSSELRELDQLTELAPRVLGLLGVRHLVTQPGVQLSGDSPLRTVCDGTDATVAVNRLAAPRAFVAGATRVATGEQEELAIVGEPRFDPRRQAILSADELDGPVSGTAGGSARVVGERDDAVTLRATLPHAGLVVLGDAWAPGWRVEVDGRDARALRTNVVLRGVAVPAGTHEIAWRYRVPGLRLGAALSALGLALLLLWGGLARRRRALVR
jgi:Bacterial membrane protein YfhO